MEEAYLFHLNIDMEEFKSHLPISLFQEIESELNRQLLNSSNSEDSTDGPIEFIKSLVDNIQAEFEELLSDS